MLEMLVHKVGMDTRGHVVVLLTDRESQRFLPILVGLWEARAIAAEMERDEVGPPERPMTHDLLASLVTELGFILDRVTITKIENGIFYAVLTLSDGIRVVEVDARPSDSIALAVRTGSPIFVSDDVLAAAEVIMDEREGEDDETEGEEDVEWFKRLMGDITLDPPEADSSNAGS